MLRKNLRPTFVEGFTAFAPELAREVSGYDGAWYDELADLQVGHFWFSARTELVSSQVSRFCRRPSAILEVGCGTGHVLAAMSQQFPGARIVGSEVLVSGLRYAQSRLPTAEFIQADIRLFPYIDEFDLILALDVIEHVREDADSLRCLAEALRPGGIVLLTVPQHRFLWSVADDRAGHVRRYERGEMRDVVEGAGLRVVHMTSFVSLLLPLMFAIRLRSRARGAAAYDMREEFELSGPINWSLYQMMRAERFLINCGVDFPVGGSLLCVAQKPF